MPQRNYDYLLAELLINEAKKFKEVESISLATLRDQYWTEETVFARKPKYIKNLSAEPEIAGIKGSYWDIPVIIFYLKDTSVITMDCYEQL